MRVNDELESGSPNVTAVLAFHPLVRLAVVVAGEVGQRCELVNGGRRNEDRVRPTAEPEGITIRGDSNSAAGTFYN